MVDRPLGVHPPGRVGDRMDEISKDEKPEPLTNAQKRGPYLPRELRIKIYNDVIVLHQQGRSYNEIRREIEQKYGVVLSMASISEWVRGIHSPYNGRKIPSLEFLEPSEDLAYDIGVLCGDGFVCEDSHARKGYRQARCRLKARDREFVEEFAIRISRVLNRPPPKTKVLSTGYYHVEVHSRTLYELCKKPIDIEKIRRYVEHCERCMAMFLRGLFDSEGHVSKGGRVSLTNSNYELLLLAQELLKRFSIETTGPYLLTKAGTPLYDPSGKMYRRKKDVYVLYVRMRCNVRFYRYVGFTILRKLARLENYLRRRGLPIPTPLVPHFTRLHA